RKTRRISEVETTAFFLRGCLRAFASSWFRRAGRAIKDVPTFVRTLERFRLRPTPPVLRSAAVGELLLRERLSAATARERRGRTTLWQSRLLARERGGLALPMRPGSIALRPDRPFQQAIDFRLTPGTLSRGISGADD